MNESAQPRRTMNAKLRDVFKPGDFDVKEFLRGLAREPSPKPSPEELPPDGLTTLAGDLGRYGDSMLEALTRAVARLDGPTPTEGPPNGKCSALGPCFGTAVAAITVARPDKSRCSIDLQRYYACADHVGAAHAYFQAQGCLVMDVPIQAAGPLRPREERLLRHLTNVRQDYAILRRQVGGGNYTGHRPTCRIAPGSHCTCGWLAIVERHALERNEGPLNIVVRKTHVGKLRVLPPVAEMTFDNTAPWNKSYRDHLQGFGSALADMLCVVRKERRGHHPRVMVVHPAAMFIVEYQDDFDGARMQEVARGHVGKLRRIGIDVYVNPNLTPDTGYLADDIFGAPVADITFANL